MLAALMAPTSATFEPFTHSVYAERSTLLSIPCELDHGDWPDMTD